MVRGFVSLILLELVSAVHFAPTIKQSSKENRFS